MNTIAEHLQYPDVTFDEHVRMSEIELGTSIAQRTPIYLDTKFWILLRDANCEKGSSTTKTLLRLLRRAVAEGIVICPISAASFIELMRQDSFESRLATAKIIDQLSLGVTIVGFEERILLEIEHLIRSTAGLNVPYSIQHAVWRRISYVLGIQYARNTELDEKTDLAIQKAFFDHMCTLSLQDMLATLGDEWIHREKDTSFASRMNEQIAEHAHELRSFQQAYQAEVAGIVDEVGAVALDVVRCLARECEQRLSVMDSAEEKEATNRWKNLIYQVLVKDKARETLPALHIRASLFASLRWDKERKFQPNDLWDFSHAEAGLSYCKALYTDRSLHNMITQKHLGLDAVYECRVGSDAQDAVEYVSSILKSG